MKIVLLYDTEAMTGYHESPSREQIVALNVALSKRHEVVALPLSVGNLMILPDIRPDLIWPFYGGRKGSRGNEATVIGYLEWLGIPYVGSTPDVAGLVCNKWHTNAVLNATGVQRQFSWLIRSQHDQLHGLLYPVFIKPNYGGSSIYVSERNVLRSYQELDDFLDGAPKDLYPWIVTEYLPGPEYTIGVIGTETSLVPLAALEVKLPLYDRAAKTGEDASFLQPAPKSAQERIKALAAEVWTTLGLRHYARIDVRMNHDGYPVVIDVNAIPGLDKHTGDFVLSGVAHGWEYETLVGKIVASAASAPATKEPAVRRKVVWEQ